MTFITCIMILHILLFYIFEKAWHLELNVPFFLAKEAKPARCTTDPEGLDTLNASSSVASPFRSIKSPLVPCRVHIDAAVTPMTLWATPPLTHTAESFNSKLWRTKVKLVLLRITSLWNWLCYKIIHSNFKSCGPWPHCFGWLPWES